MKKVAIQLFFIFKVSWDTVALSINSVQGTSNLPTLNLVENSIPRNLVELRSRQGEPTEETKCHVITDVPGYLYFITKYGFYKKYCHAYGIPIISSERVADAALKRACEVVQIMLADQHALRWYVYKNYGRIGVIAVEEDTTTIPEHRHLPSYYNIRSRGLGGTLSMPIATIGEENLLCATKDPYHAEDILVHEFAHSIMELALMRGALPGFIDRLKQSYEDAIRTRKWVNTYAASNVADYFAEGVQSYFDCNAASKVEDGVHNDVSTRLKLKRYDNQLYSLIREVFPCANTLPPRCTIGKFPPYRMDCPLTHFSPRMDLSYLYSDDYETEMANEEEEPLILIAKPSEKIIDQENNFKKLTEGSSITSTKAASETPPSFRSKATVSGRIEGKLGNSSSEEKITKWEGKRGEKKSVLSSAKNMNTPSTIRLRKNKAKTQKPSTPSVGLATSSIETRKNGVGAGNKGENSTRNRLRQATQDILKSTVMPSESASTTSGQESNNFIEADREESNMMPTADQTKLPDACEDKGWYCNYYVTRGACGEHLDWMHENCRKSCNLCNVKKPKVCRDTDPSCYIWALYDHCKPHKLSYKHMLELCPRACKFCT